MTQKLKFNSYRLPLANNNIFTLKPKKGLWLILLLSLYNIYLLFLLYDNIHFLFLFYLLNI
jgi:hypothetical protein